MKSRAAILWRGMTCLLLLLFPAPERILPPEPPQPRPPFSIGINSHLASRYPDAATMAVPADVLGELGVRWVREDVQWHRAQPAPNEWNWVFTDVAFAALQQRGIQILGVLGPAVGWGTPFPNDAPSEVSYYAPDPVAYAQFAATVAARYRGVVTYWEIWNEPDNPIFWRPSPDPVAYAQLLIRTAAAIRAANPAARIVLGGVNPFDGTFLHGVARAGGWASMDIVAIHPYIDPFSPDEGNLAAAPALVQALMYRYGNRPIWVTEVGWASGPGDRDALGVTNEQEQAAYLRRALWILWCAGVERSFWYMLKDDAHNPYGLIPYGTGRADYTGRKAAFAVLQRLVQTTFTVSACRWQNLMNNDRPVSVQGHAVGGAKPSNFPLFGRLRRPKRGKKGFSGAEGPRQPPTPEHLHRPLGCRAKKAPTPIIMPSLITTEGWLRRFQPNGGFTLAPDPCDPQHHVLRLAYHFNTSENDYLVFERATPEPLEGQPRALSLWVYGDGSDLRVRVWLRDREGEVLQYTLGAIGAPGWHRLRTPIGGRRDLGERIAGAGNGRLDYPIAFVALVLADAYAAQQGVGVVFVR